MTTKRPCPIANCSEQREGIQLLCRTHWFMLPRAMREEVWLTYHNAGGNRSIAHMAAAGHAIRLVRSLEASRYGVERDSA